VFDPFVGTGKGYILNYTCVASSPSPGSLLVAGAHFGGFGMGADIDYPLIHGRGMIKCNTFFAHFTCIWNHV
jgi:hypothetical protein